MMPWQRSEETPFVWALRVFWHRPLINLEFFVRSMNNYQDFKNEVKDTFYRWRYLLFYIPKNVKWLWQRMTRGWADCDTWGLDYYLTEVIIGSLKHLKKYRHGSPAMIMNESMSFDDLHKSWDDILDKMIKGFEAKLELLEHDYKYWAPGQPGMSEEGKELDKKWHEAAVLFINWYDALWD